MIVEITPITGSDEENQEGSSSLAWDHTTVLAGGMGIELGSDEFIRLYENIRDKYDKLGHHMGFVQHLALQTVREMLATKLVGIPQRDEQTGEDIVEVVNQLAAVVAGALVWFYTSDDTSWICNHAWEDLPESSRSVLFNFAEGGANADD